MTSPRPVRAVVFDLDGTLLDSMAVVPGVYAETIRALGGPSVSPEEVVATWHIGPTAAVIGHFLGRPSTPDDLDCYYRHLAAAIPAVAPFSGIKEMLLSLQRNGFRLGVYTAATRRAATIMLANTALADHFSTLVGGDDARAPKPDPAGLLLACQRLGVAAIDAAYVGDTDGDLRCAGAAGSLPIHAAWATPPAAITTDGHLVASHPTEVTSIVG